MKNFARLRTEMKKRHVNNLDIANAIGKSHHMVSKMLSGKARWTLLDACIVLDLLGYTGTTMLGVLFPMDELRVYEVFLDNGQKSA